jgi:hypothetical protein
LDSQKWSTSEIGTIIELGGEGQYSIFPGSIVGRNTVFGKEREPIEDSGEAAHRFRN